MATASYLKTNFNTFNPTPYKGAIDANFQTMAQIANSFAVAQMPTPIMKVKVAPGIIINGTSITIKGAYTQVDLTGSSTSAVAYDEGIGLSNGMLIESEPEPSGSTNPYYISQNNTTISGVSGASITLSNAALDTHNATWCVFSQITATIVAPVTNPRYDRIVVDSTTGVVSVITGTENANPVPPALTAGKIPLARIKLLVGQTQILNSSITDERAFLGPINTTSLGTMATQNANAVAITGGTITGIASPTNASDVAIKSYVDGLVAGLSPRTSCRCASTANLNATYNNGTSGVGATLTNNSTLAAFSLDGVSGSVGDRFLIKDQATAAQNGIYTLTTAGSGSVAWVLTRATDFDQSASNEIVEGAFTIIEEGTTNVGRLYILTSQGPFTVGTTALNFTALTVASVAASALTGTTLASNVVTSSLTAVGTLTSGTWNASVISPQYGGTGLATITSNALIKGAGTAAMVVTGITVDANNNLAGYGGTVVDNSNTSYTLASSDNGTIIRFTSNSAITVTCPNSLVKGFCCGWEAYGTGQITFQAGAGATVNSYNSQKKSAGQYAAGSIFVDQNSGGSAAEYLLTGATTT